MSEDDLNAAAKAIAEVNSLEKSDPAFVKELTTIQIKGNPKPTGEVGAVADLDALIKSDPTFTKTIGEIKLPVNVTGINQAAEDHKRMKEILDKSDIKAIPKEGGIFIA